MNETAGGELEKLIFGIDGNEARAAEYMAAISDDNPRGWAEVTEVEAVPQRAGPVLNVLAVTYASCFDYLGFMGDDHLPRTPDWDRKLVAAFGGRPGVAFGDDLNKGGELPTACVISSDIVRSLGYMCPPALEHLYLDDFWKMLGQSVRNLAYCPDVVIEHLHPTVGKADWDDGYRQANDISQFSRDEALYHQFLAGPWPVHEAALKQGLGL